MGNWLLPEGLADILPTEARKVEELRRALLDLFQTYGYELVMPPLVEYLDSLLSGTRQDLDLATCKLVDQLSGRLLGVRADMTPQVTRLDAHLLNRAGVTRLCYQGSVLHTRPAGLLAKRELLQIGAELYGHPGPESDIEVLGLAIASVTKTGIKNYRVDISHSGVVKALLENDARALANVDHIFALLRRKDSAELALLNDQIQASTLDALQTLITLYGSNEVIQKARFELPSTPAMISALDELEHIVCAFPEVNFGIDLADVQGYSYHSGIIFGVYTSGWPNAIARGGRYDNIGSAYGRARPATGFSMDLRVLAQLMEVAPPVAAIRAPWTSCATLQRKIQDLRANGQIVVQVFDGFSHDHQEFYFDRELVLLNDEWQLRHL